MLYRFLKVVEIGDLKESTKDEGREYRTILMRPISILPNGSPVFNNEKSRTRTVFGAYGDFQADPLFTGIQTGEIKRGSDVEGQVYHFNTTPYKPEGFKEYVQTYSCIVFPHEDPIKYANRQLKGYFACVVDSTGVLTAEHQLEKPTTVELTTIKK